MNRQQARRQVIRRLLTTRNVATQEELGELLADEGHQVTQATLSRDLATLRAARVARPEGGTVYVLEEVPVTGMGLRELGELVIAVEDNGHLVAVRTMPGAASAIASAVDGLRLPELLGTVAGDDTLFCAPARRRSAAQVRKTLLTMFGKTE